MQYRAIPILVAAICALAGGLALPALAGGGDDASILDDFRPTGVTEQCLQADRVAGIGVIDNSRVYFRMADDDIYLNALAQDCPRLKSAGFFSYEVQSPLLCAGNDIEVTEGAALLFEGCPLGRFEKLERRE